MTWKARVPHVFLVATLVGACQPSQQNVFTGRLTAPMLHDVLRRATALAVDQDLTRCRPERFCP